MRRIVLCIFLCLTAWVAAGTAPLGHSAAKSETAPARLASVVVATGFIPNVEFAPFYVAQDLGYYRAQGLDVTMNYDRVPNLMQAVADGTYAFGISSGDSVVIAKASGAAVTYVMAQYQKYPVGAMSLKDGGPPLNSPSNLKGRTIGISIPGSSTDIGLRALLRKGHLSDSDVKVTAIGFTETEALINKQIDVAMTYIDNEPVQAAALGHPVNVLPVSRYIKLISNGVVTSSTNARNHKVLVQKFVTATLRGLRYTLAHPNQAFTISMKRQPEITDATQIVIQRKVLAARLSFQQPPKGHPLGWSSPAGWKATISFLRSIGSIKSTVNVNSVYTSIFTNTFAVNAHV